MNRKFEPATHEALSAYLDAHGTAGPPQRAGDYVAETLFPVDPIRALHVESIGMTGICWFVGMAAGIRPENFVRHAPLPSPLALLARVEDAESALRGMWGVHHHQKRAEHERDVAIARAEAAEGNTELSAVVDQICEAIDEGPMGRTAGELVAILIRQRDAARWGD